MHGVSSPNLFRRNGKIRGSTSKMLDDYKEGIKYVKSWNEVMAMMWPLENVKRLGDKVTKKTGMQA